MLAPILRSALLLALCLGLTGQLAIADLEGERPDAKSPIAVSASFFSRYEIRDNYADLGLSGRRIGELDGVAYRARLGLATAPREIAPGRTVIVSFVPQASGFWGDVSGGLTDAGLGIHEAKLELGLKPATIEVGRFEMAYGEHLVIGDVGWHETGRSFDGARVHFSPGDSGAFVDAFATQVAEGGATMTTSPLGAGDSYFAGLYAGLGPAMSAPLTLDTYALFQIAPETNDGPMPQPFTAVEATLGARFKHQVGSVTARAEGGLQFGKRPVADASVLAFHVDGDLFLALGPSLSVGAGGAFASGDDPDTARLEGWNQLFPTAHKFLGFMDIIGPRSNITTASSKVRGRLGDVTLANDVHAFWRPESGGADSYTGLEVNTWCGLPLGQGLKLGGQYSLFLPNDAGPLGTDRTAHYVEVELRYTIQ